MTCDLYTATQEELEGVGLETERRPAMLEASGGRGQGAVWPIGAEALVALLEAGLERLVLIDSRPFVDYNSSHILDAVSVNCSKLMKRRLQQDKVHILELLQHSARKKVRPCTNPAPPAAPPPPPFFSCSSSSTTTFSYCSSSSSSGCYLLLLLLFLLPFPYPALPHPPPPHLLLLLLLLILLFS